jgi:hypothetical protein
MEAAPDRRERSLVVARALAASPTSPGPARSHRFGPPDQGRRLAVDRAGRPEPSVRFPVAPAMRRAVPTVRGARHRPRAVVAAGATAAAAVPAVPVVRVASVVRAVPVVRVASVVRAASVVRVASGVRVASVVPVVRTTPRPPAAVRVVAGATSAA